jgi:energy-coupling factor transporter ATP-binding protein EcfA2
MAARVLNELWRAVERKHRGLGQLVLASVLSAYARRTLLVVASSGSGKSTAGEILAGVVPDVVAVDTLTIAGIKYFLEHRESFPSVIFVDDLAKTPYQMSRLGTLVAVSELVYSGWLSRSVWKETVDIRGVRTSGVINIQPKILASIVPSPEWTSTLRDKTIRYYHFRLPSTFRPSVQVDYPTLPPIPDELPELRVTERAMREVSEWGQVQWSPGRARLHIAQLARAHAFLAGKARATISDVRAVQSVFAPTKLEALLVQASESTEDFLFRFELFLPLAWAWTYGQVDPREFARRHLLPRSLADFLINKCIEQRLMVRDGAVAKLAPVVRKALEEVYFEHPVRSTRNDRTGVSARNGSKSISR